MSCWSEGGHSNRTYNSENESCECISDDYYEAEERYCSECNHHCRLCTGPTHNDCTACYTRTGDGR